MRYNIYGLWKRGDYMSKISDIKEKIKNIVDPISNINFQDSQAIKHVGIDEENNLVTFVIEVTEKTPEVIKVLKLIL